MPKTLRIRQYWSSYLVLIDRFDEDEVMDGEYCFACGLELECFRCHIIPMCEGGTHELSNLHMLCHTCHRASEHLKGDAYWHWFDNRTIFEWALQEYLNTGKSLSSIPGFYVQ